MIATISNVELKLKKFELNQEVLQVNEKYFEWENS